MIKQTNQMYVIGHINPDTDSIAAAMGYAWLLNYQQDAEVVPARAGHLNPQTTWVLDRLNLDAPLLLPDASPRIDAIVHRFNTTTPDRPLHEAWEIASLTGGIAPVVNEDGTPYGLVTVMSLFSLLQEIVGANARQEEMAIADILDKPCSAACDTEVPRYQVGTRIRDGIQRMLREERTDFWAVDENGRYVGIIRQRDALNPPRLRIVLVDHNEAGQALGALDEADIYEILDHHRLGNAPTRTPIRFTVDVVGSTCTLVSERIKENGLSAPPALAGALLAGLISDTLLLTSPTTTERDRRAAKRLARWAFVGGAPLAGETVTSFGEQVLEAGAGLAARSPAEIVHADLKLYEAGGLEFGISQVEVTNRSQVTEHLESLRQALVALRDSKGLDFAALMITDVVRKASRLLMTNDVPALDDLPYPKRSDGTRDAEGVVSRKMQLLPVILGALEG